jgi:FKBP-type peptidyl-prolyl cis-trans isomerase FkpA
MKQLTSALFVILISSVVFSCDDNSLEKQRQNELDILDDYIQENYPGAEPKPSGLYYFEEVKGSGDTIKLGDKVQIYYATWSIDSMLLDESEGYTRGLRYEPMEFIVGNGDVIAGLDEAMTYMQKGTIANLVIDSKLAYGQNGNYQGNPPVPGFTTLLMQVEVYKVYPR